MESMHYCCSQQLLMHDGSRVLTWSRRSFMCWLSSPCCVSCSTCTCIAAAASPRTPSTAPVNWPSSKPTTPFSCSSSDELEASLKVPAASPKPPARWRRRRARSRRSARTRSRSRRASAARSSSSCCHKARHGLAEHSLLSRGRTLVVLLSAVPMLYLLDASLSHSIHLLLANHVVVQVLKDGERGTASSEASHSTQHGVVKVGCNGARCCCRRRLRAPPHRRCMLWGLDNLLGLHRNRSVSVLQQCVCTCIEGTVPHCQLLHPGCLHASAAPTRRCGVGSCRRVRQCQ